MTANSVEPGIKRIIPVAPDGTLQGLGSNIHKVKSAATMNATVVKASAGRLTHIVLTNHDTTPHFIKFFDMATAPDPSASVAALVFTLRIGGTTAGDGPTVIDLGDGIKFATGIAYVLTAAVTENDETATAADDVTGFLGYK